MMRALENFCRTIHSEQFLNARIEIAAVGMGDDLRMPEEFVPLEQSHLSELNLRPKGCTICLQMISNAVLGLMGYKNVS